MYINEVRNTGWQGSATRGSLSKEDSAFICVEALDAIPQKGLIFEVCLAYIISLIRSGDEFEVIFYSSYLLVQDEHFSKSLWHRNFKDKPLNLDIYVVITS